MTEFPLRLERYFFTEQQVIANPDYEIADVKHIDFLVDASANRIEGQPGKYGISAKVELNQEKSGNAPYFITITAFGILVIKDGVDPIVAEPHIETSGAQLLIGVIRERLAEMTARGPWGALYLDFVPITIKIDSNIAD